MIKQKYPLYLHLAALGIFLFVSAIYFKPVIKNKELPQSDMKQVKGMTKEIEDFERNNPGKETLWTNSMFSGMPTYQIKVGETYNIFFYSQYLFRLWLPYLTMGIMFVYFLGFYFLSCVLRFRWWLCILGALAFGLATYNIVIILAGHITKAYAIGYMAPVIAGIILIFRKRYIIGAITFTIALGVEISCGHPQITYYLAMLVALFVLFEFVFAFIDKNIRHFIISSTIVLCSVVFAVLPNSTNLLTTYEYSKHTIRGKRELSAKDEKKQVSGVDKNYAFDWSYGLSETLTLLIPDFAGGMNRFDANSSTYRFLKDKYDDTSAQNVLNGFKAYWGKMPFASPPVYFGVVIFFIFILGLFLVKDRIKWWIIAGIILSIALAWGKNFPFLSDLFFYYLPGYNKFRTVSMIFVIAALLFPLFAIYTISELTNDEMPVAKKRKYLRISTIITGGVVLTLIFIGQYIFDFETENDQSVFSQLSRQGVDAMNILSMKDAVVSDRIDIMTSDAWRSLLFIGLSFGVIFVYLKTKMKAWMLALAIGVLVVADLWKVDQRYLNEKSFVLKRNYNNNFTATRADSIILADKELDFRVHIMASYAFSNSSTSYFHKTIGGYHGAKLRRYQDMVEGPILSDIKQIENILLKTPYPRPVDSVLSGLHILNMLNVKYIIINERSPIKNIYALGNAWFVKYYRLVGNADEEYNAMYSFNPWYEAVIDSSFAHEFECVADSVVIPVGGNIQLTKYEPNHLVYQTEADMTRLAVFSEIYYVPGWNAYIDGVKKSHFRANYILRAMIVPPGKHTIEFKFEPLIYYTGQKISLISSSIIILLLLTAFIFRKKLHDMSLNKTTLTS